MLNVLPILHKWQERKECKQREPEMAAAAEHTEEHTAQIHNMPHPIVALQYFVIFLN